MPTAQGDGYRASLAGAIEEEPLFLESGLGVDRDRLSVEPPCRRRVDCGGALDMGERNQDDATDARIETSLQEVGEPDCIGLRKKAFRARCEQDACEVNHNVDATNSRRQSGRIGQVGLNGRNVWRIRQLSSERFSVIHQAKFVAGGKKVATEQAAQIASRTGDQDRGQRGYTNRGSF